MNQLNTTQDSVLFVILGATGDLTKRKLIPALYNLIKKQRVKKFALLGVSIEHTTADFMLEQARAFVNDFDQTIWNSIQKSSYYYQMDFYREPSYDGLGDLIKVIEAKHALQENRLFYLATMPHHFGVITQNLARSGIANASLANVSTNSNWQRVVYEKPFGQNKESAQEINAQIARYFKEDQVFRIDHWLGKELVANIAFVRFTNIIFEPVWNNQFIDSVQIVLSEKQGINGRGAFYDAYGLLKDVVQNHVLQILALVCMEPPKNFTAEMLRLEKVKLLEQVVPHTIVRAQYEGYKEENGVAHDSTTDTFAALKLSVDNDRWRGVPLYIKAGKALDKDAAAVHIKFKMANCLLEFCPVDSNYLTINIQPNEGFFLELNVKEPGVFNRVQPVNLNFSHSSVWGPNTPAAYEVLLLDVMRGDHFAFVHEDEIQQSWRIIEDALLLPHDVVTYQKNTTGPSNIHTIDLEREIQWRT